MRYGRWVYLCSGEDNQNRPLGTPDAHAPAPVTPADMPSPVGALLGVNVYTSEAISSTLGAGANQDQIIAFRESDWYLWLGEPIMSLFSDVLSGTLTARVQYRRYAAFIARYPSSIGVLTGTGMVVATNE